MLKVCVVTEDFYPKFIGGQGVYGYHLVTRLDKLGCKVTVLAENKVGRKEFWKGKGVRVLLIPFCFGNQLILSLLEYLIFILRYRNEYFDIVHANQLSGLFFVLLRPKNVGKIIVSAHNTNYDMAQITTSPIKWLLYQPLIWLERIIYQKADGILFNTEDEQKSLISYYQIKNPIKVIHLGVDIPNVSLVQRQKARKQIRTQLGLGQNSKLVLYVGRLVKRKKVDILIKALQKLKSNVYGLIIGDGEERKVLEKIASKNIKFLGFIEDTRPYFLASDCFVTVSAAEGGIVLTALEAASFGLPLILSANAGGNSLIKEGINGFVASGDAVALAKKIKSACQKSNSMGKMSFQFARSLTWEKTAKKTLNFYLSLKRD